MLLLAYTAYILVTSINFYKKVNKIVFGILVIGSNIGVLGGLWSFSLVSIGFVSYDSRVAIPFVLPFLFFLILVSVLMMIVMARWGEEAIYINKEYLKLDREVKKRTNSLREKVKEVEFERNKILSIVEHIAEGVLMTDKEGKILSVNKEGKKILQIGQENIIGVNLADIITIFDRKSHKIPKQKGLFYRLCKKGDCAIHERFVIQLKNKERMVSEMSATELSQNNEVLGVVIIFRDITKEAKIDRQKSEFISIASHQLRTPISTIKWYLDMLLDGKESKLKKRSENAGAYCL